MDLSIVETFNDFLSNITQNPNNVMWRLELECGLINFDTMSIETRHYLHDTLQTMLEILIKIKYSKKNLLFDMFPMNFIPCKMYDTITQWKLDQNDKFCDNPKQFKMYKTKSIMKENNELYTNIFQYHTRWLLIATVKRITGAKIPKYLINHILKLKNDMDVSDMGDDSLRLYKEFLVYRDMWVHKKNHEKQSVILRFGCYRRLEMFMTLHKTEGCITYEPRKRVTIKIPLDSIKKKYRTVATKTTGSLSNQINPFEFDCFSKLKEEMYGIKIYKSKTDFIIKIYDCECDDLKSKIGLTTNSFYYLLK